MPSAASAAPGAGFSSRETFCALDPEAQEEEEDWERPVGEIGVAISSGGLSFGQRPWLGAARPAFCEGGCGSMIADVYAGGGLLAREWIVKERAKLA